MMYAFCRNLCKILFCLLLCATSAFAATNAPQTGLESGSKYSYGPESENKHSSGVPTGRTIVDAYGRVILPEEDVKSSRERLRSGAYGGAGEQYSRPLPDLPETDAGWKFK